MLNSLSVQSRLSKAIAEAFAAEGMKVEGLQVRPSFNSGFKVTMRLEPAVADERAVARNKLMATSLGLPEDFAGKTLRVNRRLMKVTGFNPGAPKNAVNLECLETGKGYKCSPQYALACPVIS